MEEDKTGMETETAARSNAKIKIKLKSPPLHLRSPHTTAVTSRNKI